MFHHLDAIFGRARTESEFYCKTLVLSSFNVIFMVHKALFFSKIISKLGLSSKFHNIEKKKFRPKAVILYNLKVKQKKSSFSLSLNVFTKCINNDLIAEITPTEKRH